MAVVQNYLPGDPLLIDKIVYELKSQGIFDQFRKECIADVDTKPAYQNLRQRVEGSVSGFLSKQKWSSDMNKNQVREMLRKNIHESGFLETGVERIVDQVVNPKINSVFLPKVTEVVYKFLGIEKPTNDKKENLKLTFNNDNLLPTDLEAVSPESEKKFDISNDSQNLDDSKIDEDESPPFEPLEEKPLYIPPEENSVDSHLSGFSGLMSHDSNHSQEFSKPTQMEISNQDSLLSKQSSEGRLSIVMSDDNDTKMEICEDSCPKASKSSETKLKDFDFNSENLNNNNSSKKPESKVEEKPKSDKSSKSHDKHKSRHDGSKSEKKDDKDKRSDKDRKEHKDKHSSRDRGKEKDRKDSKSGSSKSDKDRSDSKSEKESKSDSKSDKDKSKSSSSSSNRHSSSSSSKDKDKERSSSSKKESSSSKDRGDNKDKSKSSSSKDKDVKHKDDKSKGDSKSASKHDSKSDKHKKDDKHRSDRHSSSSKNRDKEKKDSKKEKKESKDDHFSSKKRSDRRSTDRDSNDGQSGLKNSSSSFDSYTSSHTQNKSQESSNSNSNNGSGDSGNSDAAEECTNSNNTAITILNEKIEELEEVAINAEAHVSMPPALKLIKPKFASNIHEARRLMKIRKQLKLLEKQNFLNLSHIVNKNVTEDQKPEGENYKVEPKANNNKINNISVHNNNHTLKQDPNLITTSPNKVKEPTPEPLSPPLKSSVVSAATWDALEAKLHESINYSTCYDAMDTPENTEMAESYNKDDCLYLELDSSEKTQRYINFTTEYITKLQDTIDKQISTKVKNKSVQPRNHLNNVNRNLKRKFTDYHSDVKNNNNNKKFNTHHIEVHENFSLPLSPAESDNSIDKKSDTSESSDKSIKKTQTEYIDKVKKTIRGSAKTQRYSSEDLYKPRPIFGGSRRRNGKTLGLD